MSDEEEKAQTALTLSSAQALIPFQVNEVFNRMALGAVDYALVLSRHDDAIANPAFSKGEANFGQSKIGDAIKHYTIAAELGHLIAQLRLGGIYLEGIGGHQDYAAAFRWFTRAADQGEPRAQLKLGWMNEAGLGIPSDSRRAVYWYRIAAEAGNPEAQFNIGVKYDNGEGVEHNAEEAVRWFLMAAEQGLLDAQYFLGQSLEAGEGIEQNQQEANDWYFLASEQGHASAKRRFWSLCLSGTFKPENYEETLFAELIGQQMGNNGPHFREGLRLIQSLESTVYTEILKACGGTPESQFSLGLRYANGNGVLRDYDAAVFWYRRASAKCHAGAFNNLGNIFSRRDTGMFNEPEALRCFHKAAELGSEVGMYNFACWLLDGIGIRKNVKRAIKLFEASAKQKYCLSMTMLGDLYYIGELVDVNYTEALKWYSKAASHKFANGYFGLGLLHGQGLGLTKDLELAKSYFEKAVDLEPSYALRLADFYENGVIFAADPEIASMWKDRAQKHDVDNATAEQTLLIAKSISGRGRTERLSEKRNKARPILGVFD
ncbi:MAG: sel1 repeat family protein [Methylocystaceae bacterium]|nr:sel1 repeat family protein [Methylocystaceae bacterium]